MEAISREALVMEEDEMANENCRTLMGMLSRLFSASHYAITVKWCIHLF
jgi:hypothetical protein